MLSAALGMLSCTGLMGGGTPMQKMSHIDTALSRPDWQGADGYKILWNVDRSGWAWQWLRRDANFKEALKSSTCLTGVGCGVIHHGAVHNLRPWGMMFHRSGEASEDLLEPCRLPSDHHRYRRSYLLCDRSRRSFRPEGGGGYRHGPEAAWRA